MLVCGCRRSCLLSHSSHVSGVSFCYPFLGRFSDPILFFPFCRLCLAAGCYLLDVSRDNVDGRLFSFLLEGALGCVVPWLLAVETVYAGFPSVRACWCDRYLLPFLLLLWARWFSPHRSGFTSIVVCWSPSLLTDILRPVVPEVIS